MSSSTFLAGVGVGLVVGFVLFVAILHKRGWSLWQRWDHEPW